MVCDVIRVRITIRETANSQCGLIERLHKLLIMSPKFPVEPTEPAFDGWPGTVIYFLAFLGEAEVFRK